MDTSKQKILIVGNDLISNRLAQFLGQKVEIEKIYITSANIKTQNSERIETIDIREDDINELLNFVVKNDITLTIPCSVKSIKADIVSLFQSNEQNIFAPNKNASKIVWDNTYAKKFLYKIHAQTTNFSIFDRIQTAIDYLKTAQYPILIRTQEYNNVEDRLVCPSISLARDFVEKLFSKGETNIIAEYFINGHNFTIYFVTDGYSAIPITTVANYKFKLDGNAGLYTNGVGCYTTDYQVAQTTIAQINKIVNNTLHSLNNKGDSYLGILGVNCTLKDNTSFVVNEFYSFFQEHDITAVLNSIDDDFIKIMFDCINGIFSDEYESITTNNLSSVTVKVDSKHKENIDFTNFSYIDKLNNNEIFATETASTLNRAKTNLYDILNNIKQEKLQYRKDIAKTLEEY